MRDFTRFVGVDLGGGKGKTTALAVVRAANGRAVVEALAPRPGDAPLYDESLVAQIASVEAEHPGRVVLAMDAPLTLPPCLRCTRPRCPGQDACEDPAVQAMQRLSAGVTQARDHRRGKPLVTPYTQRATEVYLHRERGILPRETLGQGMGPLTARAAHLLRALAPTFRLNENLIEVYPKATVMSLGFDQPYKKHMLERETRAAILHALEDDLSFAPGVWREECVQSDHTFDAVMCAFTALLWARDDWQAPGDLVAITREDGWIWTPPAAATDDTEHDHETNLPDAQVR